MAKRRTLKCSKCDRRFSMAAHLARHLNTIHRKKRKKKVTKKRRPKAKRRVKRRKVVAKKKTRGTRRQQSKAKRRAGRRKSVTRKRAGRPKGKRTARRRSLGEVTATLIAQLQAHQNSLALERESLDLQIEAVARALEVMGTTSRSSPAGRRAKRSGSTADRARPGSLKVYIIKVLRKRSKPMYPRDIAKSVKKAGFRTKAKDLTKAVSNTLPNLAGVKKVGRGLYRG